MTSGQTHNDQELEQGKSHGPEFVLAPIELLHDNTISDAAKITFLHMYWRYGANHRNFEGRNSMAAFRGKQPRAITDHAAQLEDAGWIFIERHTDKDGWQTTNFYHVFFSKALCQAWKDQHGEKSPARMVKNHYAASQKITNQYLDTDHLDTNELDSFPEDAIAPQSSALDPELDDLSSYRNLPKQRQTQASARLTTPSAFNTPHLQSSAKVSSPKADKPAKAPKEDLSSYDLRVAANKPKLTDCILRALAMALFDCTDDPVSIASYEGRLKWIMYGKKEPDFTLGLIKFEQRRNNGVCDYQGIADALEGFKPYVARRRLLAGMVQSPKNFIGYWQEYRNERNKADEWVAD